MNFEFSAEQQQLKDEVRRMLGELSSSTAVREVLEAGTGIDRALWSTFGELGFTGAAIPDAYGGTGAGYLELCVICEEVGRANAAIPLSSSICQGAELILECGTEERKQRWLPTLATGSTIACVAVVETPGDATADSIATRFRGGVVIGNKVAVADGGVADIAIVAARGDAGVSLYIVDLAGPGVTRSVLTTIDPTRDHASIVFQDAPADLLVANGWPALTRAFDRAAVLAAFEQLGGAERALEMARNYALERYAFGRAIGSFQAIKHKLVDMYVAVALARSNCYYGAWALSQDAPELPEAAAAARVSATQASQLCTKENIQVHGGMGFTWEFDCHLYYRRAHLLALSLGGLGHWQNRLIDQLRDHRDSRLEG